MPLDFPSFRLCQAISVGLLGLPSFAVTADLGTSKEMALRSLPYLQYS